MHVADHGCDRGQGVQPYPNLLIHQGYMYRAKLPCRSQPSPMNIRTD